MLLYFSLLLALSQALTHEECISFDMKTLSKSISKTTKKVKEVVGENDKYRVETGFMHMIVDEADGEESGGGTNTFGCYGTTLFNGPSIFPDGVCDIPTSEGDDRCGEDGTGATVSFMLGETDVLAMLMCTPPPVKYYSYDVDIATRLTETYPYYPGVNFGDPINYRNVNLENKDNVYNQPILVLHSYDNDAANEVADAYVDALGINRDSINIKGLSDTVLYYDRTNNQTWYESQPDILSFIFRVTGPSNESMIDYKKYENITWPVQIFFNNNVFTSKNPIPTSLTDRESLNVPNEKALYLDDFNAFHASVATQVLHDYSNATYRGEVWMTYSAAGFYDDWEDILDDKDNSSFILPTRDATYGIGYCSNQESYNCYLDEKTVAVLIGMLHTPLLNASYSSVGLDVMLPSGTMLETHWLMDDDLAGSADRYNLDGTLRNTDMMFAIDFTPPGGCNSFQFNPKWCVEFNSSTYAIDASMLMLFPGERIYSLSETMIGPSNTTAINSRVLIMDVHAF